VGLSIGAALVGARPIVDLMFIEHLLYAAGDFAQQAALLPALSGGRLVLPIVFRACVGIGLGAGPFYSGNYHSFFAGLPGVRVVAPATPHDAKGMLAAAIDCDEPVLFLEHKLLLATRGPVAEGSYEISLDRCAVVHEGQSLTIVAYGLMVGRALEAARQLETAGHQVEVIDLRSLAPLEMETIIASVAKTGRLMIVDDAFGPCSISAEISAQVAAHAVDYLDAPIERLSSRLEPVPYSPALESSAAPIVEDIVRHVQRFAQA
jgi:pyruvate/2-oxoglutarate/acetoin dehydrogenase E1 component